MHSSALIAPFLLAAGASGFVSGPPCRSRFSGGARVAGVASQQQQAIGRQGGSGTAIAMMSSTAPPQLPDMNQNLSGGDFDNWFWGDAHVKGGVEHAVFEGAKSAVVLFDGECNFCNSGVWMMISNSKARNLRFCAQNSEIGLSLLHSFGQDQERLSSIAVLDKHGHLYTRSCAIVHIMARMDVPFPAAAAVLKAVPRPIRDAAYGFVSRRRHMFGTESMSCRIPEEDEVERFLL